MTLGINCKQTVDLGVRRHQKQALDQGGLVGSLVLQEFRQEEQFEPGHYRTPPAFGTDRLTPP